MKRHPTLQPLSRQHHLGLVIANKAKSVTDDDKLTQHQAFILTVAGATVGFGATWRFPYLVGETVVRVCVFILCRDAGYRHPDDF
ncbi:neurotransmitter symporter family protein, partial [Neisseria meningitidis NM255]